MWESWELVAAAPKSNNLNDNGYAEPSIKKLTKMLSDKPVKEGWTLGVEPFVLPVSLSEFQEIFVNDNAPYFFV